MVFCCFLPILNSSKLTQFAKDLGIFPVWSWLYLQKKTDEQGNF